MSYESYKLHMETKHLLDSAEKTYSKPGVSVKSLPAVARSNSRHPRTSMGTERFASKLEVPREETNLRHS